MVRCRHWARQSLGAPQDSQNREPSLHPVMHNTASGWWSSSPSESIGRPLQACRTNHNLCFPLRRNSQENRIATIARRILDQRPRCSERLKLKQPRRVVGPPSQIPTQDIDSIPELDLVPATRSPMHAVQTPAQKSSKLLSHLNALSLCRRSFTNPTRHKGLRGASQWTWWRESRISTHSRSSKVGKRGTSPKRAVPE